MARDQKQPTHGTRISKLGSHQSPSEAPNLDQPGIKQRLDVLRLKNFAVHTSSYLKMSGRRQYKNLAICVAAGEE